MDTTTKPPQPLMALTGLGNITTRASRRRCVTWECAGRRFEGTCRTAPQAACGEITEGWQIPCSTPVEAALVLAALVDTDAHPVGAWEGDCNDTSECYRHAPSTRPRAPPRGWQLTAGNNRAAARFPRRPVCDRRAVGCAPGLPPGRPSSSAGDQSALIGRRRLGRITRGNHSERFAGAAAVVF
jgi:hypothetical protein